MIDFETMIERKASDLEKLSKKIEKKSKKKEEKSDEILIKYKEQQAAERGFSFLKDPLFFGVVIKMTSSGRTQRGTSFSIKLNIKAE
jgi:transposase